MIVVLNAAVHTSPSGLEYSEKGSSLKVPWLRATTLQVSSPLAAPLWLEYKMRERQCGLQSAGSWDALTESLNTSMAPKK